MLRRFRILMSLCALCAFGPLCFGQTARLQLQSQPGDFVGQGGTFDITYQSPADTIAAHISHRRTDGVPDYLDWVLDSPVAGNQFAIVDFATNQLGVPIQAGLYPNAQRAPF